MLRKFPQGRDTMPSLYTHQILAEKVMELLPERTRRYVTREGEYFLGAQGGDVFYLYKMREGQKNLGKYLHRKNVYMVFCNFLEAARSGGLPRSCHPAAH